MPDDRTAAARLRRILHVLPMAARDEGATLDELAETLDVELSTVLGDLDEVTARSYYLPAGAADRLQIEITEKRIRVWTAGDFRRPVKLLPREALALGLGLRALAAAEGSRIDEGRAERLRERLEAHLATLPVDELRPHHARFEPAGDVPAADADGEGAVADHGRFSGNGPGRASSGVGPDVPGTLFEATREVRPCRIRYLKPGAPEPEDRTVHPWTVARAEGRWYILGRDPEADDGRVRIFRLDRMLEAELAEGTFEVPDDFDPADHVDLGRLFRADGGTEVLVRYSPRIARWIEEKPWAGDVAGSEREADGALVVRHRVVDPRWLLGHVLQYGPDAEVLEPERFRRRVRETLEEVSA